MKKGLRITAIVALAAGLIGVGIGIRKHTAKPRTVDVHALFDTLYTKHEVVLRRLLAVESHIDGLAPEFRGLMHDQKDPWALNLKDDGKRLPDGLLTLALVSERKRMESEVSFLNELAEHPEEQAQHVPKIASWLLRLDATNLLASYAEKMDTLNRSNTRQIAAKDSTDLNKEISTMKFAAATLLLQEYTKDMKSGLALSKPEIVTLAPSGKTLVAVLEKGIGKMSEDGLPALSPTSSAQAQEKTELVRAARTLEAVQLCDKLEQGIWSANQRYANEYIASLKHATQQWEDYLAKHKTR